MKRYTHSRQAKFSQLESMALQSTLLDNLVSAAIIVDPQTHVIEKVNPAAAALFGAPAGQIEGRSCHQFLCPAQVGACPITDLGQVVDNSDRQLITADATRIRVMKSVKRVQIARQEKLLESFVDISERIRAEEALRESEAMFRTLVEQNIEGVVLVDEQGVVIEWNAGKVHITGISTEEAIGKYYWDLQFRMLLPEQRTPERLAGLKSKILQALQTGQSALFAQPISAVIQRADGQTVYIEQTIFPIKTSLGYRIGSLTQDISERNQAMQAIRESEELFRASFENATAGISLVGTNGRFLRTNGKLSEIVGYSQEELQRMTFNDLTLPEDRSIGNEYLKQMLTGQLDKATFEKRYVHKTGRIIWTSISTGIVRKNSGEPLYFVSHTQDITEAKAAQQELQRRLVEMQALHTVAMAGTTATSQDDLFRQAIAAGHTLYPRDFGIGLIDESCGMLRFPFYIKGDGRPAPDTPLGMGVTGRVALTGKLVRLEDVRTDAGYIDADPQSQSELCVPILVSGNVIGVINVESDQIAAFGEADERILNALAGEMGTALEKIRLYAKTEQQVERLTALRTIDQSILSGLELGNTLDILLDKFTRLLHIDAATILLYDPREKRLKPAASRGLPATYRPEVPLLPDTWLPRRVARLKQLQFLPDLSQVADDAGLAARGIVAGFLSYLAMPLLAKGELKGVLEIFQRTHLEPSLDWMDFLEALIGQTAIAIDDIQLFAEQQQLNQRVIKAYDDTLDGWSRALDQRDHETEGHSQRVADLTLRLAEKLGIPEDQFVHLRRGAKLHDIGKMGIPDGILLKRGVLNEEEWVIMRQHPEKALDFLSRIEYLKPALEIPYNHHEKWDGSGYPQGLKGEEIPLFARIFMLVDVYDALTSDRPYRQAWTKLRALQYIWENKGKHFDPRLTDAFLAMMQTA